MNFKCLINNSKSERRLTKWILRHGLLAFGFGHHFSFVARVGRQRPVHFVSVGLVGGCWRRLLSLFQPMAVVALAVFFPDNLRPHNLE